MSAVKEATLSAHIAFSHQGAWIATGTVAGALDVNFSNSSKLEASCPAATLVCKGATQTQFLGASQYATRAVPTLGALWGLLRNSTFLGLCPAICQTGASSLGSLQQLHSPLLSIFAQAGSRVTSLSDCSACQCQSRCRSGSIIIVAWGLPSASQTLQSNVTRPQETNRLSPAPTSISCTTCMCFRTAV